MSAKQGIGKFLSGLIGIPIAVLVVVFAIANRQGVTVDFWPLPYQVDLPLAVVLMASVIGGFLLGALVHWLIAAPLRWRAHQATRRAEAAERELAVLRAERQPLPVAAADPQQRVLPHRADAA